MRTRSAIAASVGMALLAAGCGGGGNPTSTPSVTTKTTPVTTSTARSTTAPSTTSTTKQGGGGSQTSRPSTPDATVEDALTAQDPKLACSLYSDALLRSAYGDLDGCVAAIESGGSAKSVKILSTNSSGSTATVVAVPSGGPSSGEKLTYALVMEDGQWRLDQVKSNVKVGP